MSVVDHESFAQALMVYAREEVARNQSLRAHPSPEKLAAYHADELSEAEDLEIQRHLAICSECPALLIDLEDLFEPRQRELGLSDSWVASAWEDLRSRLGGKGRPGGPRPQAKEPWWAWFSAALRPAVLATAGMAVLCVGLTSRLLYLEEANRFRPLMNAPTRTVSEAAQTRGGEEPDLSTADQESVNLAFDLDPYRSRGYEHFTLQILDLQEEEIHSVEDLRLNDENQLTIGLKRGALPAGLYRVKALGVHDGEGETRVVGRFLIEVSKDQVPENGGPSL